MSADKVLATNKLSGAIVKSMTKFEDPLRQTQRIGVIRNMAIRRRSVNVQPFGFSQTISVSVPKVNYLGDAYLVVKTPVLTGTDAAWRARWATQLISRFSLRNSGRLIQEIDNFPAVYNYFLDRLSNEKLRQVQKLEGQAGGSVVQTVCIPIPTFWSTWTKPDFDNTKSSPLHYQLINSNEGIVFEFLTNSLDRCCSVNPTNANPITSCELVFYEHLTEPDLELKHKQEQYVFQATDFKVRSAIALAAGTKTQVDITALTGGNKLYWVNNVANTDSANEAYCNRTALSHMSLDIDGRSYMEQNTSVENACDNLLWGGLGASTDDCGANYILMGHDAMCGFRSHLQTRDTKDIRINLTSPVASVCDIVAVQDVKFTISNNGIFRHE